MPFSAYGGGSSEHDCIQRSRVSRGVTSYYLEPWYPWRNVHKHSHVVRLRGPKVLKIDVFGGQASARSLLGRAMGSGRQVIMRARVGYDDEALPALIGDGEACYAPRPRSTHLCRVSSFISDKISVFAHFSRKKIAPDRAADVAIGPCPGGPKPIFSDSRGQGWNRLRA